MFYQYFYEYHVFPYLYCIVAFASLVGLLCKRVDGIRLNSDNIEVLEAEKGAEKMIKKEPPKPASNKKPLSKKEDSKKAD